jgi:hypothetical protein
MEIKIHRQRNKHRTNRIVVLSADPGRVVDSFTPELPHPSDRLSPEYGQLREKGRKSIESVLGEWTQAVHGQALICPSTPHFLEQDGLATASCNT